MWTGLCVPTVYSKQCTVYNTNSVQYTVYNTYSVQYTVYNTYSIQYTVYNTYSLQFSTVFSASPAQNTRSSEKHSVGDRLACTVQKC